MDKPNFFDLPLNIKERMLWEMDLDYDHYDGTSKESVIHSILCGNKPSDYNTRIIESYYDRNFDNETLKSWFKQELESLLTQTIAIKEWIRKCK